MAVSYDPTDPFQLTEDQRLDELATLLAIGVRRLLALRTSAAPESPANCLEVCADLSLHVSRPVNAAGERI